MADQDWWQDNLGERRMNKDTKGNHIEPNEDSLLRELKKEIIKLKSLNRRAAEEIKEVGREMNTC